MVAINFKAKFADAVEGGEKRQTIRRTARCKPGDRLQLYTGQRTKKCRRLREVVCTDVYPIQITQTSIVVDGMIYALGSVMAYHYAKMDGFEGAPDMVEFFRKQYGLPFDGFLIEWRQKHSWE